MPEVGDDQKPLKLSFLERKTRERKEKKKQKQKQKQKQKLVASSSFCIKEIVNNGKSQQRPISLPRKKEGKYPNNNNIKLRI